MNFVWSRHNSVICDVCTHGPFALQHAGFGARSDVNKRDQDMGKKRHSTSVKNGQRFHSDSKSQSRVSRIVLISTVLTFNKTDLVFCGHSYRSILLGASHSVRITQT